ncbi:uncharacterized protein N7479_009601 [Penicillium vulpinum]|uniref:Uncharacterized protein n=1 Tax=Penicillium vulpinum TaxID=29845 RepID=A0A1V6RZ81_9EURO|nr:uncharacterized protein N7479_009601 [Penicillium vulpinum]KAJ5951188.1 hypothetical protein N7479_009601 [Penicillium vulpinum]OQE06770.1 hypothetical protein PENVUL_c016G07252 [Penicillium vulpinum]
MSLPELPLWCRVILLILAICSFLPQILRFQTKQTTNGVSSLYVLWNLIHATEQLTIYIYFMFTEGEPDGTIFLHSPPSTGDRFSLWHCAVVAMLFLTLFAQVLLYSDRSSRIALVAGYTSFLLVSIIPLISDAISQIDYEARRFWSAVFFALHCMLIYPILTAIGVWGIYRQAREISAVPFPNALSLQSLAMQAVVFTLVSVTWIYCLPFPYEKIDRQRDLNWTAFSVWYGAIGWIIIDSFIFALGQAVLLLLALHRSSSSKVTTQRGSETEPLLGHEAQE